ncbi:MAG: site-specific integrase [Clostridia bacterium]|nr:site-specific integrase [Clostridia bacterium]
MVKEKLYTRTLMLPDGKRKYIRAKTEKEVERKLLEAQMQLHQGVNISDKTTVTELAQIWYNAFKRDQLHAKSLEIIKGTLNRYVVPQIGSLPVRDVKPLHIQMLMQSVAHLSQSSQRKVLTYTRAVFQLGVDNGLIAKSPVVASIKVKAATPEPEEPLTRQQTDELLAATKDTRAYPFILLALYGGLRKGEVLGVKWSDIDFKTGVVHVNRSVVFTSDNRAGEINTDMKTVAAHRAVPLPLPVLEYFRQAQRESKSEYVLSMPKTGDHLTEGGFRNVWGAVERRSAKASAATTLNKTFNFTVHPHQLRHTCITRWFEAGLDLKQIQYLAGHATVEMTLRVYTHYDRKSREAETTERIRAAQLCPDAL